MAKNKRSLAYYLGRRGLDLGGLCRRQSLNNVDDVISFCDSLNLEHPSVDDINAAMGLEATVEESVAEESKDDKKQGKQKVASVTDEKPDSSKA